MIEGDVDTGKTKLRLYINAIVGFEELCKAIGTPPKSLMRMFGPHGNPTANKLFVMVGHLQKKSGTPASATTRWPQRVSTRSRPSAMAQRAMA